MHTTQAYKSVLKLPGDTLLSHGPGFEPEDAEDDHRRVDSRERVAHGHQEHVAYAVVVWWVIGTEGDERAERQPE